MITEGVDYSFARPQPRALANAGKKFAVRYGGPGSDSKMLTASELAALRAVGIDVVANAEGAAGGYNSEAVGRSWARSAEADFRRLGMPGDRPIYFSVDFDAGPAHWSGIDAALRGSAAVIGKDRVGVYGSYDVIEHCAATGLATWLWQTYAWSGGRKHPKANLYQYRNGVTIGGGDCDLTRALTEDYGQWLYRKDDAVPNTPLTPAEADMAIDRFLDTEVINPYANAPRTLRDMLRYIPSQAGVAAAVAPGLAALSAKLDAVIKAINADDDVDESAIIAGVVAGLTPAIAANIPADVAQQVVEILKARLAE